MALAGKSGSEISNDDSTNDEWNPAFAENIDDENNDLNVYDLDDEPNELDIFRNFFPENSLEKFGSSASFNNRLLNPSVSIANISSNEESDLVQYLGGNAPLNATTLTPPTSRSPTMSVLSVESATKMRQFEQGINELCMSKNAVAARENRKRKKNYVQRLESSIGQLKSENEQLKDKNIGLEGTVEKLQTEIEYLKNVNANQSALSHLIGHIHKTPGIKFQSSFTMYRPTTQSANKENFDENDNIKNPVNCGTEKVVGKHKQTCKRKATESQNIPIINSGLDISHKRMCTRSKKVEKANTRSSSSSSSENDVLDESLVKKALSVLKERSVPA